MTSFFLDGATTQLNDLLVQVLETSGRFQELVDKGSAGGYFGHAYGDGPPSLMMQLGHVPPSKAQGRFDYCVEKLDRLKLHPEHRRSYDSRDPENGKWGGAVRGTHGRYSFSGLPEEIDEVFSTLVAVWDNDLSYEAAEQILGAERSGKYLPIVAQYAWVEDSGFDQVGVPHHRGPKSSGPLD